MVGWPANSISVAGVKMRTSPRGGIVHEHGLAEPEVGSHGLAPLRRHVGAVEEHGEGVSALSLLVAKDTKKMQDRHHGRG